MNRACIAKKTLQILHSLTSFHFSKMIIQTIRNAKNSGLLGFFSHTVLSFPSSLFLLLYYAMKISAVPLKMCKHLQWSNKLKALTHIQPFVVMVTI